MTRKHFQALAAQIALLPTLGERQDAVSLLTPVLSSSNPRFNVARFRAAAGAE